MPKRSAEERIECYRRKINELTKNCQKRRRVHVMYSDSSEEDEECQIATTVVQIHDENADSLDAPPVLSRDPQEDPQETLPDNSAIVADVPVRQDQTAEASISPPETSTEQPVADTSPELDPELLLALGESPDDTPDYGEKINENLAKLWPSILKKGMLKEAKEKSFKEYLVPDNCRLLQAPTLNAEISAAVPEMVRNRDKTIMTQQQQVGHGITAINRALDLLLKGDDKKKAIQHLSSGCCILADLHSTFTQNRIKLVTPSLDKNILHVIQDSERDETLFGNKLSDKIKAAKAIERQGNQIKKATGAKTNSSTNNSNRTNNSGNWQAPPRNQSNRGGRGGWRKPGAARRSYQNTNTTQQQQNPKPAAAAKPRASTTQ